MPSYRSSNMKLFFTSRGYPNGPPIIAASSMVTSYSLEPVFLPNSGKNMKHTLNIPSSNIISTLSQFLTFKLYTYPRLNPKVIHYCSTPPPEDGPFITTTCIPIFFVLRILSHEKKKKKKKKKLTQNFQSWKT